MNKYARRQKRKKIRTCVAIRISPTVHVIVFPDLAVSIYVVILSTSHRKLIVGTEANCNEDGRKIQGKSHVSRALLTHTH